MAQLKCGAGVVDISPPNGTFLAGYPHVPRYSTGVHDPLLSSAMYLDSDGPRALIIANDIIYITKPLAARARQRIEQQTGVPASNILISATHTHSGPKTTDTLSNEADKAVPKFDPTYVAFLEDRIVEAAVKATQQPVDAEIGLAIADATGVGTNRRDPKGASNLKVPVMLVRESATHKNIAAMLVCSMHPTVMHEDSTLVSGDFPGLARQYLQQAILGADCTVLYHTGPAGDQSPRHVVRGQTFSEAERLGKILGDAAINAMKSIRFGRNVKIECRQRFVNLPVRSFPSEADAQKKLDASVARLKSLRQSNAPRADVRTAETDWFGATETLTLSRAASQNRLGKVAEACMPAEIQAILIGPWSFVAWPGETFVELGLAVIHGCPNSFVIAYANGELQGYLVTKAAVEQGGYEASNAIFKSPDGGDMLVSATLDLLKDRCA